MSLFVRTTVGWLLMLTLLATASVTTAQEATRTFGTASPVVYTMSAFGFTGVSGTDNASVEVAFGSRRCQNSCNLRAPVLLPAGALVSRIELAACDTIASGEANAALTRVTGVEGGALNIGFVNTGVSAGLGCNFFAADLATPETIDNFDNTYYLHVALTGTPTARFQAVRLYYTLQVSPAPTTARFNDVPTSHVFFPWIEALAASGVTTGCNVSPPLYCPDDFVTRGQMAVFLSRALGLHFAP